MDALRGQMCKPIRPQCAPGIERNNSTSQMSAHHFQNEFDIPRRARTAEMFKILSRPLQDPDRDKHTEELFHIAPRRVGNSIMLDNTYKPIAPLFYVSRTLPTAELNRRLGSSRIKIIHESEYSLLTRIVLGGWKWHNDPQKRVTILIVMHTT